MYKHYLILFYLYFVIIQKLLFQQGNILNCFLVSTIEDNAIIEGEN